MHNRHVCSVSSQEEQIKADEEFARQLQNSFSNTQNLELTFEDVNQMSEEALIELVLGESSTRTFGDVARQTLLTCTNQNQSSMMDDGDHGIFQLQSLVPEIQIPLVHPRDDLQGFRPCWVCAACVTVEV